MKLLIPLFILLAGGLAFGQTIQNKIANFDKAKSYQVNYDKFKDVTTVFSPLKGIKGESKNINPNIDFYIVMTFTGTQPKDSPTYWLGFRSSSSEWRFLESHNLIVLAGDTKIDLGPGTHNGKVNGGNSGYSRYAIRSSVSVTEWMTYKLTPKQLEALANSKQIEIQLGRIEGKVAPESLEMIKNMKSLAP